MKKLKTLSLILTSLLIISCRYPSLIDYEKDYESSQETNETNKSTTVENSTKTKSKTETKTDDENTESLTKFEHKTKLDEIKLEVKTDETKTEVTEMEKTEIMETEIIEDTEITVEEETETVEETIESEETEIVETEINEFNDEKYKINNYDLLYIIKDCECDIRIIDYNITHDNQSCYVNKRSHNGDIESIKIRYCYLGTKGYNECDIYLYHIDNDIAIYHWKYDNSKTTISSATFENNVLMINTISN